MTKKLAIAATLLLYSSLPWRAQAATIDLSFAGPGVSAVVHLTYGSATDANYAQAFEITGITGVFSDTNSGLDIINAPIGSLMLVKHDTPEPGNLLAPNDFSRFAVATGLGPQNNGFLTYDNLYWPGGSLPTATNYQVHGGVFDIYGLMFTIGGGRVVDIWSNGDFTGTGRGPIDYGIGVATSATALDYISGSVAQVPEPGTIGLLGAGLLGMLTRRRAARNRPTNTRQN